MIKIDSSLDSLLDIKQWRKPQFWRDSFLYYWIFSLFGHILELFWGFAGMQLGLKTPEKFASIPIFAIAAPYGLGAIILILFVYPLVRQRKIGIIGAFFLSVILTTIVEIISALAIVIVLGNNPYWDYSNRPFNLFGFATLGNSLAFGVASIIALYLVFPLISSVRKKFNEKLLNWAFWIIVIGYAATLLNNLR